MEKYYWSKCLALIVFIGLAYAWTYENKIIHIIYPESWPDPVYDFDERPLSEGKIELGRKLFYDPILSADNTISCASCHLSYTAFTHVDHKLSHGIHDSIGFRNSPTLINLAWSKHFMWDGAINHIEAQPLAPITDPAEMGETLEHVIKKLNHSEIYPNLFEDVYGEPEVTTANLLNALAQFQLTFVSADSKYDKVKAGLDTFSFQERKGYALFQENCASCHREPLFTRGDFANNGLAIDTVHQDMGRYRITQSPTDSFLFKIPTLRNIEYSYPYMHDGRFRSLYEVMNHYTDGVQSHSTLSPELKTGIHLSSKEKTDIVAFLLTLSDKGFLFNKDFAFPRG